MAEPQRQIRITGSRVLLVDDDPLLRELIAAMLTKAGAALILEAGDGGEAVAVARQNPVDWAVLDIQMEPVDGLQFLKSLRIGELPLPRDLPVAVLTVLDEEFVLGAALALDCQAFITKSHSMRVTYQQLLALDGRLVDIKPAVAYRVIALDKYDLSSASTSPQPHLHGQVPDQDSAPDLPGEAMSIPEIPTGSILLEDVMAVHGARLVASGTPVTDSLRQRLLDLREVLASEVIRIRLPDARSD